MRPLWQRWPTVLAIIAFILNVDLVVMPALTCFGVHGWYLFFAAAFAATAEPVYWNWYAKWVVRNVNRSERVRRIKKAFADQGIADQFRAFLEDKFDWFVEHARIHADGEGNALLRERAVAFIRRTHIVMMYPTMLLLGCAPSGWPFAIFLQRIFPVPAGFVVFLAANAVKTYLLGRLFLWLPWWGKVGVIVGALVFLFVSTGTVVKRVNALKPPVSDGLP